MSQAPSFESNTRIGSLLAGAAVSAYRFVTINASDNVRQTAAGGRVDGVAEFPVDTVGQPVTICQDGIVVLEAGGSITDGAALIPTTNGRAIVTTDGNCYAVALEAASTGEWFRAWLAPKNAAGAAPEVITNTPGAISVATEVTLISPDGTDAMTLASGGYDGQKKTIRMIAGTNTPVAAITGVFNEDGTARTTLTLNATGEGVDLVWLTSAWRLVRNYGTSPTFS